MPPREDGPSRPEARPPRPENGSRRWRRQPEARPQQILEAARRTFTSKGYFGATLDDVAREAGITKGTIYLYYPSKQALFSEMLRAYADEALGGLRAEAAAGRPVPGPELIRRLVTQFQKLFRRPDYQAMLRLIIGEAGRFPEEAEAFYREVILKRTQEVATFFEAAMDRGEIRRLDPLLVARGAVAMVWGFVLAQETMRGEAVTPWPEAVVVDTFSSILWEGLKR